MKNFLVILTTVGFSFSASALQFMSRAEKTALIEISQGVSTPSKIIAKVLGSKPVINGVEFSIGDLVCKNLANPSSASCSLKVFANRSNDGTYFQDAAVYTYSKTSAHQWQLVSSKRLAAEDLNADDIVD